MASTSSPYSPAPAFPVLAYSLLPQSYQCHGNILRTWDLKDDFHKAFSNSTDSIFRSGTVIGFSKLRNQSKENDDNEFIGQVTRSLLTAQLCKPSPSVSSVAKAYIIHPASLDIFSPKRLLESLISTSQQPALSREEAISCLDSVQLFPVFDLAAAVQAIGEVSDTLQRYQVERELHRPCETEPTANDDCLVFLVVAGLDILTEGVIRASSTVRGTAVLSNVMRTLTELSRMHSSYLSVMLANASGLGTMTPNTHRISGQVQQRRSQGTNESSIHSIFQANETSLFPSLLMRTLEQGIDTHILLSVVKSVQMVEVIKDRVGNGLGRWSIWEEQKDPSKQQLQAR